MARILPLLVFLGSLTILAELIAQAEFFDVPAAIAIMARGSYLALFGLSFAVAALTTVFLNLDTTAVLLTPAMLATAVRAGIPTTPLAMTTVWLANIASLLLPGPNLTNLLAAGRVGAPALAFAARMALPQLGALVATAVCLWVFFWHRARRANDRLLPTGWSAWRRVWRPKAGGRNRLLLLTGCRQSNASVGACAGPAGQVAPVRTPERSQGESCRWYGSDRSGRRSPGRKRCAPNTPGLR
jgi:hypothetical protein